MKNHYKILSTASIAICLCACSSSNSDSIPTQPNGDILIRLGLVEIDEFSPGGGGSDYIAEFRKATVSPETFAVFQEEILLNTGSSDFCNVLGEAQPSPYSLRFNNGWANWTYISAGEIITIGSEQGSFTELSLNTDEDGDLIYEQPDPVLAPGSPGSSNTQPDLIPDSLFFDIPGNEYPAFSNFTLSRPPALSGVSLELDDSFSADTILSWNPVSAGNSVTLLLSSRAPELDHRVFCTMQDDGNFSLPSSVAMNLDELLGSDWEMNVDDIERVMTNLDTREQGTVVLVGFRESSID